MIATQTACFAAFLVFFTRYYQYRFEVVHLAFTIQLLHDREEIYSRLLSKSNEKDAPGAQENEDNPDSTEEESV